MIRTLPSLLMPSIPSSSLPPRKLIIHFLRHGQASHNVNAERMRHVEKCSFEAFVNQMRIDDEFDANLTPAGMNQAASAGERNNLLHESHKRRNIELVVCSSLSRAIDTADTVLPYIKKRVIRDEWREISGLLLNAKRLSKSKIIQKYHGNWDGSYIPDEEDVLWTEDKLESTESTTFRAYSGLKHLWEHSPPLNNVAISGHGGIFYYILNECKMVRCVEESVKARFENCEMRSLVMTEDGREEGGEIRFKMEMMVDDNDE